MTAIRFRLIGSRADADDVIVGLHGLKGIGHIEEVGDSTWDIGGDSGVGEAVSDSGAHCYGIEVEVTSDSRADAVRGNAEVLAHACGTGIEFVDEF